ncbi:hypothetical protein O6H91_16G014100 [Diphasiastrum complanatum]|uniref:Uncharacterized protein n=8 Tax=Diphasiastrum complanatum TaxID=34168 RepID=A0ACC2BA02_DIPCM|nr:hypothetical protein O6H91_16G014100 [Diphasiastrum complanatum]KAJ7526599.1 hypothetical protein O6H91_16G014100 [Diphasiastrum complanatum]KAJ7526600.1 hypothetical protein O6H91_16G014100 [Diphasiastrum complanatum]KAJ7526601.1 hypothetical protein O6H91_16G014100 [Diphasiastrum complanatum]KAJ7526602.1 hypothetical protein O6H91_16G014100 [Diphasiastrum complanatum]
MEEEDDEFEQLLGEIPRATSAPPHLEELQRVYGSQGTGNLFESGREEFSKRIADIRFDEHYEGYYRSYSGVKKLPPPLDNASDYLDLPSLSPKAAVNQLSSFYSGLALDSPRSNPQRLRLLEMQQKHQAHEQGHGPLQQHEISQQQCDLPDCDLLGDPILANGIFANERTLSSTISASNFKTNGQSIHRNGLQQGNEAERVVNGIVDLRLVNGALEGELVSGSTDLYSHVDAFVSASAGYGSVTGGILDSLMNNSESLDFFANKSSPMQSLKQGVFPGLQNLPSGLSVQALENMLRKGSPIPEAFSAGYTSEVDGRIKGSAYYQKPLHQEDTFSVTAAEMQATQFIQNGSDHLSDLYSRQYRISHDLGFSNLQAQKLFQQAEVLQQSQHLQIIQQLQEDTAIKEQQMQQHVYVQRQKQLQKEQLHARLYAQNQAVSGEFLSNVPKGFALKRGHQALPSMVGSNARQQALLHRSQLVGSVQDMGWIEQQSQEAALNVLDSTPLSQSGNLCRFFAQGYCSRGSSCRFSHSPVHAAISFGASQDYRMPTSLPVDGKSTLYGGEHLSRRNSRGTNLIAGTTATVSGMRNKGAVDGQSKLLGNANGNQLSRSFSMNMPDHMSEDLSELQLQRHAISPGLHHHQQQFKYTSLQDVEGRIFAIAKDQHGCRFLQRKFDEGDPEEMQKIFLEIIEHIIELMTDPFGNYLVQKLLEVCTEVQHMKILHAVTAKCQLVAISLNMHGTRAVQKLIETLKSPDQIGLVISSLRQGVVTLIKDLNGNHVVQRCLQRLNNEENEFIFDAAASNCVEIATHRHGCCVLQRCVDFASGAQHQRLVAEIAANALVLSQDQYGNYVVQYVLDLGIPWAMVEVMVRLEGNYALLSSQKFSSNVVEKCLKLAGDENRTRIVNELMSNSVLGQLLQDPFANYVLQCALTVTKGALHASLVEAIRPHLPALRTSPYGKRILSRSNLKR